MIKISKIPKPPILVSIILGGKWIKYARHYDPNKNIITI